PCLTTAISYYTAKVFFWLYFFEFQSEGTYSPVFIFLTPVRPLA
ncbi:unnamed protein product, partial [Amoebophrya sp. A25]